MLVLVTNRDDLTADWLVAELRRRDAPFVRFNTEDYPAKASFNWTLAGSCLEFGHHRIESERVSAVWWRRPAGHCAQHDRTRAEAAWASGEADEALKGFWRQTNAHWVNHPHANELARNKPEQLLRARRQGLDVPATLITNSPADLRAFAAGRDGVVCKTMNNAQIPPPSTGTEERVLYTALLDRATLADVDDLGPEPYLFQELVPKRHDLRVTVIGNRVFGCRILSQEVAASAVDWRRGDSATLRHEPVELEPDLGSACIALARSSSRRSPG